MAGVSTKEIKNRIRSMESTRQITKAMEMVAASKLRRAQAQVLNSRPYFQIFSDTIQDILASNRDFSSPYLKERSGNKVLYVVIAGDRGLAGSGISCEDQMIGDRRDFHAALCTELTDADEVEKALYIVFDFVQSHQRIEFGENVFQGFSGIFCGRYCSDSGFLYCGDRRCRRFRCRGSREGRFLR